MGSLSESEYSYSQNIWQYIKMQMKDDPFFFLDFNIYLNHIYILHCLVRVARLLIRCLITYAIEVARLLGHFICLWASWLQLQHYNSRQKDYDRGSCTCEALKLLAVDRFRFRTRPRLLFLFSLLSLILNKWTSGEFCSFEGLCLVSRRLAHVF